MGICLNCGKMLNEQSLQDFCNRSCSMSYSNKNREKSIETRLKLGAARRKIVAEKYSTFVLKCLHCGVEFESKDLNRKVCSRDCGGKAYKDFASIIIGRKCLQCGLIIGNKVLDVQFCSSICDDSYNENRPVEKMNELSKLLQSNGLYKCPHCEKEFKKAGIYSHIWRMHTEEGRNFDIGTKGKPAWNSGLTAETDERVKQNAINSGKALKGNKNYQKLSEEKKLQMKLNLSNVMKQKHKDGTAHNIGSQRWKKEPSYPEKFFMEVIKNEFSDKSYTRELYMGKYVIDFAWKKKKLAIEINGDQHYRTQEAIDRDKAKTDFLENEGWKVLWIRWADMFNNPKHWIQIANDFIGE